MKQVIALLALVLALPVHADQLGVFKNTLSDVQSRARTFRSHARTQLRSGGPNQNAVISNAGTLSRGADELSAHLAAKQVDQFDTDLGTISDARDAIDNAIGAAGAPGALRSEWKLLRDATDAMLQIASGNQTAQVTPGDEAPPVVAPQVAGAPRTSRVNLVGPDELHFAAADLAAILDTLAGQVSRYGRMDGARRAALDSLGAMRRHCDAIAGAPTIDELRPTAQQLTGLINNCDRTLPNLGDYGTRRPMWQAARKLAMGIIKHAN